MDTSNVQQIQTVTETSEPADANKFNSFHFWREPLPSIDSDLLDLLVRLTQTNISVSCSAG